MVYGHNNDKLLASTIRLQAVDVSPFRLREGLVNKLTYVTKKGELERATKSKR
ncbi:hypothetical protein PHYBLDRAFT_148097 [Phycomyces blakesleeanus NRRL 1555(-)]|uniref:Uncharacterized protein n=1 Tax=Phycomyces blakesleeanus (strain ATCC 8743b / DSM 1359 / FGSC 10004 / NBRC 33097 / NRRL 1555) TaxID=763407 RepID=A0A167LPZ7_PHYB8|nr:hypothetical protein PHYBLDRAFT_148097 [Phycomyces blakesleeanus NRRL 1555(-)]OAD70877.1 hypothetical protein PHYBLDRAFT_148097 [Phycomyces blakesleeanus NRRL 1555(-)]|eukprot:XP_018288917.1 hypothetical protein PHYBLDRAFT_148097 [Phycomyces blakesleeanus NRRL 1555(-)]